MALIQLIQGFSCLFGDNPSRTHLFVHDIDVGNTKPIKQRFYWVNAKKRRFMDAEIGKWYRRAFFLQLVVAMFAFPKVG